MPLEPIDDKDLDLESKFAGGAPEKTFKSAAEKEMAPPPENIQEENEPRKEGATEKDAAYSRILSRVKTHKLSSDDDIPHDAQAADAEISAQAKVEKLVQLAVNKGVVHAVKVAKHLDDNYALDEFHDRLLADDLHAALVAKGLIKEI